MKAVFLHYYPGAWHCPAYRTADHTIPWLQFVQLVGKTHMLDLRLRVQSSLAGIYGEGSLHMSENDGEKAARIRAEWIDGAYPEQA
jgi:hypothetical protein